VLLLFSGEGWGEGFINNTQNIICALQYIMIPEAYNLKTTLHQLGRSARK